MARRRGAVKCAVCGAVVKGGVSRPYGGYVCHRCLMAGLKIAVRLMGA